MALVQVRKMAALQWSQAMEELFNRYITLPVLNHPKTDWETNVSLGYPFDFIRRQVIKMGRADFRDGHDHHKFGDLSADEKVLLYCFINMKQHFFESLATFRHYRSRLAPLVNAERRLLMIDLGCGPGTAALALAEIFDEPTLHYVGLDQAKPMLEKARGLFEAAKAASLLAPASRIKTTTSWSTARQAAGALNKPVNVLLKASYLFASETLDVDDVCHLIRALRNRPVVERLLLTYTNSSADTAGQKFVSLKRKLAGTFESSGDSEVTIEFHKKRSSETTSESTYTRELLVLKEG
jgi:SAM-dependent methyltransferase